MKAINLFSLINAREDLPDKQFIKYLDQFGINPRIRTSEIRDLKHFITELSNYSKISYIFNYYYVGFMIKQIGKEFDLLRVGENSVINIELKRVSTEEKAKKQLVQNRHYLKFLDLPVHNYTYISKYNKLYTLNDQNELVETTFHHLIKKLKAQNIREIEDLDDLFDPTNYLVSPFNSPDAFMEEKYFLSAQQSTYKREIIVSNNRFFSIVGGAGTGKSLLTYDIAREYMKLGKKVLIFNCGKLNQGHDILIQKYHWPIYCIQEFNLDILKEYDVIIFDEAQRMYREKFIKLTELLKETNIKCIFSYDPNQTITTFEIESNIPQLIQAYLNPTEFELTEIIRHNKEIHAFITKLFDLKKEIAVEKFEDVSIQYFSSLKATKSYLYFLKLNGWKIIDYTNSHYVKYSEEEMEEEYELDMYLPEVLGLEYDNVVVVLDEYFYYKSNNQLGVKVDEDSSIYQPIKMLYQNICRTRKKLHIVINNNSELLGKILNILN